jgi:hypothetical protein
MWSLLWYPLRHSIRHRTRSHVTVPTVIPVLQEVLSTAATASVQGPAKGELPTMSSNLHLEAATTLEATQLLEILSTAPQVLGLPENPVKGYNHSWLIILSLS